MVTLEEAARLMKEYIPEGFALCNGCGEAQGKYIFGIYNISGGMDLPCGVNWTVDKETGECKNERLKHEYLSPCAPIVGYKRLCETDWY